MLLITKDGVEALKERLKTPSEASQCREELRKMLEIKEALRWRAEARTCCNVPWELQSHLNWEIKLLQEALEALEEEDGERAAAILKDYASHLEGVEGNSKY